MKRFLDAFRLLVRYQGISIRGQMQYKASFLLMSAGTFLITGVEFLAILVLFGRFDAIAGWRLPEVAFLYGLVNVAFSLADTFSRGFCVFAGMLKSGDFDRLLLRPRSTALQLAGQELTMRRAGRLTQGLAVLLWSAANLGVAWSLGKTALLLLAILGCCSLFYGIFVLQATLAFWTTETLEIVNCVSYGGVFAMQYPLPIYQAWFRRFLTFVVPIGTVAYFPALALMGKADPLGSPLAFQVCAPLIGAAFLAMALQVWKLGVRRYQSAGG